MSEYEYVHKSFDKEGGSVDIPDAAEGVTVDYFNNFAVVQYLIPVDQ